MTFDYEKHLTDEKVGATKIALLASFERYFRFMFYCINEKPVLFKPFHKQICFKLEQMGKGKNEKRNLVMNVPVGSGKSLLLEFWISWCFARNINNAFVYTSYNSDLIMQLSQETREICENPAWQKLFGGEMKTDDSSKASWSFTGSATRTGLKAKAMGGGLTGLDAGNPNIETFSGALIIDDPVDAVKGMVYPKTRNDCVKFYDDKLATRRRTPTTPTVLVMQRLHKEDLTGWLLSKEPDDWDVLTIPAVNSKGESFWPERYPLDEMDKIKNVNPYKFQSQYQQNPINAGGNVIKPEWFKYYEELPETLDRVFITADTAQKVKEHNDYTVIMAWGTKGNKLYMLDMLRGKWEAPELLIRAKAFYNLHKKVRETFCHGMYIEDKASGTGLIQQLNSEGGIPVVALQRNTDKLTRVEGVLNFIYQGDVLLPISDDYGINPEILAETSSFQRDDSHSHDDIVDNIVDGIEVGLTGGGVSILDVI